MSLQRYLFSVINDRYWLHYEVFKSMGLFETAMGAFGQKLVRT